MRSHRVTNISDYLSPSAQGWEKVSGEEISLIPTPLAMQPTEYIRNSWARRTYGAAKSLKVASVHDGQTWAIRVTWQGVSPKGTDFPDALAIAMPVSGKPVLALMGAADAPIHYLRWAANKEGIRSIIATGIGKSVAGPSIKGKSSGVAADNIWNVVITRPLGSGKEVAPLLAGKKTQIGFAVWYGANDERAGIKAFSVDWADLALDA